MLLGEVREEIVRVCRELSSAGLVVGTAGNVSVRSGDLVAVTPSGLEYADLSAGLVGVHRLDGTPVEAPLKPTSELPLHLAVYAGTDAAAVVHTHSLAATAVSTLADELPAIHYYVAMFGGPVRVSPYATYGTDQLARNVVEALRGRTGCIMGSHGAVTIGPDLKTAHTRSLYLEWLSDLYLRATAAGKPRLLPPEEIEAVARKLTTYGQGVSLGGGAGDWGGAAPMRTGRQRVPSVPIAAWVPLRPPPGPRRTKAIPTAMAPPTKGPIRYAHHEVQSFSTRAGPSDRAGFIDAPLTGEPHSPARAM